MKVEKITATEFCLKHCKKGHQIPITLKKENNDKNSFYNIFLEGLEKFDRVNNIK